jgi:glycosyltransferase involved in cell wall biosynthesis
MTLPSPRIAVLVPCFNEEAAVATVVADFRKALPSAQIYVYDNNSKDRTAAVAREAGAVVRAERRQGKGHVVRRMFADIDADIYVLVDGDATYDAASAPRMIDMLVNDHLDMVVGLRVDQNKAAYRIGHRTGNLLLTRFLADVFGQSFKDILSGYRVFSRRFVKSFPILSGGFEIETELSSRCRSPRSRRPITRGPKDRSRSSTPGAMAPASSARCSSSIARKSRCDSSRRSESAWR